MSIKQQKFHVKLTLNASYNDIIAAKNAGKLIAVTLVESGPVVSAASLTDLIQSSFAINMMRNLLAEDIAEIWGGGEAPFSEIPYGIDIVFPSNDAHCLISDDPDAPLSFTYELSEADFSSGFPGLYAAYNSGQWTPPDTESGSGDSGGDDPGGDPEFTE